VRAPYFKTGGKLRGHKTGGQKGTLAPGKSHALLGDAKMVFDAGGGMGLRGGQQGQKRVGTESFGGRVENGCCGWGWSKKKKERNINWAGGNDTLRVGHHENKKIAKPVRDHPEGNRGTNQHKG